MAHLSDDETVAKMGHPSWWFGQMLATRPTIPSDPNLPIDMSDGFLLGFIYSIRFSVCAAVAPEILIRLPFSASTLFYEFL